MKEVSKSISTHSDYITKELSSLVLLNKEIAEKPELMLEYEISKNEIIDKKTISIYAFELSGNVREITIDNEGIEVESFDTEINKQSQMFDKIYHYTSDNE